MTKPTVSRSIVAPAGAALEQRRDPGPRARPQPLEAELRDRPVLAHHRRDVRDGPDRRRGPRARAPRLRVRQLAEQQPRDGERDAAAGQVPFRIGRVRALRVHERDRRRQHVGQVMVVRDDDVDAALAGGGHLGDARGARVDGDDQRDSPSAAAVDRGERQAVALLEPRRHVRDRVDPEAAEGEDELREPGEPVRVEVAEHHHPLATRAGAGDPLDDERGVRQQPRDRAARRSRGRGTRRAPPRPRRRAARGPSPRTSRGRPPGGLPEPGFEPHRVREDPAVTGVGHGTEHATRHSPGTCRMGRARRARRATRRRVRIRAPAEAGPRDHVAARRLGRAAWLRGASCPPTRATPRAAGSR